MLNMVTMIVGDTKYSIEREKLEHTILYGSLLETIDSDNSNNIVLPVVECVSKEAIEDYIDFLQPSNDRNKRLLKECLKNCSIVGDADYLLYNVKRLLVEYTSYKDILDDVNHNLLRDIYLLFPLSLIPDNLKDDGLFFSSWLQSMRININNYEFGGITVDLIHTYKYIFGVGARDSNTLMSMKGYLNNVLDGPQYFWYKNGNKKLLDTYNFGQKHGPSKLWSENGVLLLNTNIKNGVRHGSHNEWFESGRKKMSCMYEYDKLDGAYMKWEDEDDSDTNQQELIAHLIYSKGNVIHVEVNKLHIYFASANNSDNDTDDSDIYDNETDDHNQYGANFNPDTDFSTGSDSDSDSDHED